MEISESGTQLSDRACAFAVVLSLAALDFPVRMQIDPAFYLLSRLSLPPSSLLSVVLLCLAAMAESAAVAASAVLASSSPPAAAIAH